MFASVEVTSQHRPTYPHLPQAADTATDFPQSAPRFRRTSAGGAGAFHLARELNQDIDAVNRGLLPKHTVSKLKRVEKLAKRLRKEIAP
jgi:hypothetical protein